MVDQARCHGCGGMARVAGTSHALAAMCSTFNCGPGLGVVFSSAGCMISFWIVSIVQADSTDSRCLVADSGQYLMRVALHIGCETILLYRYF